MNDDPSASTTADPPQFHNAYPVAEADILQWEDTNPTSADGRERGRIRRRTEKRRRIEMLDDVVRNLDIMIFCELTLLYYMEYVQQLLNSDVVGANRASWQLFVISLSHPRIC